jgi:hypothetical protein
MQHDDIEVLATGHLKFYGPRAQLMIDEIIKTHSLNEDWDAVRKWNRVKIRISRRELRAKGEAHIFPLKEQ